MKKPDRLSTPMCRVLFYLREGMPQWSGCSTMGDYGGLDSTMKALRRRGLVDRENKLTEKGKEAADALAQ
jgi:hypothetical protein